MASLNEHLQRIMTSGGRHEIVIGTLKDVRSGVSASSGNAYRMATVAFEGGKEMFSFSSDEKESFETLPPEGTRVIAIAQVDSERDRKGSLQVFRRNPQFFLLKPAGESAPAGSMPADLAERMRQRAEQGKAAS